MWYYLDKNGYELLSLGEYRVLNYKIGCDIELVCPIISADICSYEIFNDLFIAARENVEFNFPTIVRTGEYAIYVINLKKGTREIFYNIDDFSYFLKLNNFESHMGYYLQKGIKSGC